MFGNRIIEFGKKTKNRLDDVWLEAALSYINHGEEVLALDTLCDYLVEYAVCLSRDEYDEMIELAGEMGFDTDAGNFKYLRENA